MVMVEGRGFATTARCYFNKMAGLSPKLAIMMLDSCLGSSEHFRTKKNTVAIFKIFD